MTFTLHTRSAVRLSDAKHHLEALTAHLTEHGMAAERIGGDVEFRTKDGVARLSALGNGLSISTSKILVFDPVSPCRFPPAARYAATRRCRGCSRASSNPAPRSRRS